MQGTGIFDGEVLVVDRSVEPRAENREPCYPDSTSPLARVFLYMTDRSRLHLSKLGRRVYKAWKRQYHVSELERWRNQTNACAMGGNPYICEVDLSRCRTRGSRC